MFIDHMGAAVLEPAGFYTTAIPLRIIGRMAFPIFIFLLIEGFFHTHDRKAYALRLFLFALLSEIPFNLAFFPVSPDLSGSRISVSDHQNVILTLFFGFCVMCAIDAMEQTTADRLIKSIAMCIIAVAGIGAGFLCHTDYSGIGVLAILVGYLIRRMGRSRILAFFLIVLVLCLSSFIEAFALLSLIPVAFYKGKKGRTINKWFFYFFYPAHILFLWAFRVFVFMPFLLPK